jgi:hypothetical protein
LILQRVTAGKAKRNRMKLTDLKWLPNKKARDAKAETLAKRYAPLAGDACRNWTGVFAVHSGPPVKAHHCRYVSIYENLS